MKYSFYLLNHAWLVTMQLHFFPLIVGTVMLCIVDVIEHGF
jgi:hypothetical protein